MFTVHFLVQPAIGNSQAVYAQLLPCFYGITLGGQPILSMTIPQGGETARLVPDVSGIDALGVGEIRVLLHYIFSGHSPRPEDNVHPFVLGCKLGTDGLWMIETAFVTDNSGTRVELEAISETTFTVTFPVGEVAA